MPARATPASYMSCPRRRTSRAAVGDVERAGGVVGGELAERVTGRRDDVWGDGVAHRRPHGRSVREQRRLRVVRARQLVGGPVEHELRERHAERGVDGGERLARGSERVGEIAGHSGRLRSLSGKEENDWRHRGRAGREERRRCGTAAQKRTIMEAHVKPAPNATSSTVEPSFTRPDSIASSSAMPMEADDVLPKRSTLT